MRSRLSIFVFLALWSTFPATMHAQDVELSYFSIMVLPYTADGERVSEVLSARPEVRGAITELESTLLEMNLNVLDFAARYDAYLTADRLREDTPDAFLAYAKPDIHCVLSMEDIDCPSDRHKARVTIKTYFTSSGRLLFSATEDSNCFVREAEHLQLVRRAIRLLEEDFRAKLLQALNRTARQGQSFDLVLSTDANGLLDFERSVSGYADYRTLGTALSGWLTDVAASDVTYFRPTTTSRHELRFDDVRLPFYVTGTQRLYPITDFERRLKRMVDELTLTDEGQKITANVTRQNGIMTVLLEPVGQ